jgi:hypothetical protein
MLNLTAEASVLGALIEDARGVVGAVVGTTGSELRAVVGHVADGDTSAAAAASITDELGTIGALLGLGQLGTASVKSATAARVFARQSGAVLAIELDPKSPLVELEIKLQTLEWAPQDELPEEFIEPLVNRTPTRPRSDRTASPTLPPPFPGSVQEKFKTAGSGPVFTGDLEEFCLPDLLEFLRNTHRSGLLMCMTSTGIGTIELSRGMIIAAHSPNALDLRQHFLTSAELTPERRRALADLPAESFSDDAIEDVLVSRNLIPRDDVARARVARIYSAFREMMNWTAGRFSFDPGVPVMATPALALSAQSILMQLCEEQDEQGR